MTWNARGRTSDLPLDISVRKASAGGQDEQPCDVKSSTTTGRSPADATMGKRPRARPAKIGMRSATAILQWNGVQRSFVPPAPVRYVSRLHEIVSSAASRSAARAGCGGGNKPGTGGSKSPADRRSSIGGNLTSDRRRIRPLLATSSDGSAPSKLVGGTRRREREWSGDHRRAF